MSTTRKICLAFLATASLTACVVAPPAAVHREPVIYRQPVMVAPPPLREEYQGYPPAAGYVWITGFWNWTGLRHEWHPGHWEAPREGQRWVPHRWEQDGDRWQSRGGHWEDHGRGHRDHGDR